MKEDTMECEEETEFQKATREWLDCKCDDDIPFNGIVACKHWQARCEAGAHLEWEANGYQRQEDTI
jgi:hypothetical protein